MPEQYPSNLPGPTVNGFGATVASGVIRAESGSHQEQRRVHTTMPHTFTLSFVMSLAQWAQWQLWALEYGYRWFEIDLPTLYAGKLEESVAPALIRFTSEFNAALLAAEQVQITVAAELAPSMIAAYLEDVP